jgi:putative membrane protein
MPSKQNSVSRSELFSLEQTKLANSRTLLAYIRTSLSFLAAAAALIEFFNKSLMLKSIAYISISLGIFFLLIGIHSYYHSRRTIKDTLLY